LSLNQLLIPSHVLIGLEVTSKKRLFEEMGFFFEQAAGLDRSLVTDCLFARERLGSTGLGFGVAIPHGRIKGLKEPRIAAIRLQNPIAFDAADGLPVNFAFVMLVPEKAVQKHLDLLAEMAELLGDDDRREALKGALTAESLIAIVHNGAET